MVSVKIGLFGPVDRVLSVLSRKLKWLANSFDISALSFLLLIVNNGGFRFLLCFSYAYAIAYAIASIITNYFREYGLVLKKQRRDYEEGF